MTEFKTPTDISEKEKIVGGLITAGQLIWLAVGILITVGGGLLLANSMSYYGFIVGAIIGLPIGVAFAFYRPKKLSFLQFLMLKMARRKCEKKLPNHDPAIDEVEFNYFKIDRL